MDRLRYFRQRFDHSVDRFDHRYCLCVLMRPVGRAVLAQHLRLDSHLVEGIVSVDMMWSNMAHALDAGLRLRFIWSSLARASDAHRSASATHL